MVAKLVCFGRAFQLQIERERWNASVLLVLLLVDLGKICKAADFFKKNEARADPGYVVHGLDPESAPPFGGFSA